MKLLYTVFFLVSSLNIIYGDEFPDMSKLVLNGYEANLEVTDIKGMTISVREYFLEPIDMGRLDIKMAGEKTTFVYWKSKDEIASVNKETGSCDIDKLSSHNLMKDVFYWRWSTQYNERLLIGGLAILFASKNENDKPKQVEDTTVRGIPADVFYKRYKSDKEDMEVWFHFAKKEAILPYQQQVPLRIIENGTSADGESIERIMEISFFKGSAPSEEFFQVPYGYGCKSLVTDKNIPKLPDQYSYTAEVLTKGESINDDSLNAFKVVKNTEPKFVLYQQYAMDSFNNFEIRDFESGLIYTRTAESSCSYKPLKEDSMPTYPAIVEQAERKDFYRIGTTKLRGIECDVWEHVHEDDTVSKFYKRPRVVVTRFFSRDFEIALEEDDQAKQIPIQVLVTEFEQAALDEEKGKKWESKSKTYINIYNFKSKWNSLPLDYNVEKCFKKPSERRYFEIHYSGSQKVARNAEEVEYLFKKNIIDFFTSVVGINSLRIPYINVEFKTMEIFVQIMLLEKVELVDGMDEGPKQMNLEELTYYLSYTIDQEALSFEIPSAENKEDMILYTAKNIYPISLDTYIKKRTLIE